jgi:hypothetical protein
VIFPFLCQIKAAKMHYSPINAVSYPEAVQQAECRNGLVFTGPAPAHQQQENQQQHDNEVFVHILKRLVEEMSRHQRQKNGDLLQKSMNKWINPKLSRKQHVSVAEDRPRCLFVRYTCREQAEE